MANITFTEAAEKAAPTTSDEIPIWDVAAGQAKKATINAILNTRLTGGGTIATGGFTLTLGGTSAVNGTLSGGGTVATGGFTLTVGGTSAVNGTLSGGGTVATGGFTLTVPATGTSALLGTAQTFTATQTISPSNTGADGLIVNMPASTTENAIEVDFNGISRLRYSARSAFNQFFLSSFDNGAGISSQFIAGRNSNGSTPAPGCLRTERANGSTFDALYSDDSGVWRTLNASPTNANFAGGTVVGSQSSHKVFKDVLGDPVSPAKALAHILAATERIKRFVYKDGRFGGQEFSGLVLDGPNLDRYGMDADPEHPAGKALNEINAIGDLMLAVAALYERIKKLEAQ